jgi:Fe2+ transport system protein B
MSENKDIAGALNPQEPTKDEMVTMTKAEYEKQLAAESDKRVNQALKTHDEKKAIEFEKRLEKEKKDAARLASLSEEERYKEEMARKSEELEQKDKDINRRELMLDAMKIMDERGLPVKFTELLLGENATDTLKNIDVLEKEWKAEIAKAVEQRFKGKTPPAGSPPEKSKDMNAIIRDMARR